MGTISEIIKIIADRTGTPLARVKWTARRLNEAGLLPRASGANVPKLSSRDVAILLLGVLSGASGADVAEVTKQLAGLKEIPSHVGMPGAKDYTAADTITHVLNVVQKPSDPERQLYIHAQIEVTETWPQVRLMSNGKCEMDFVICGCDPSSWQSTKVKRSAVLPGIAIASIVDDIAKLPK